MYAPVPTAPASIGNIQIALLCNPASISAVESIDKSSPPTLTGHAKKSKSATCLAPLPTNDIVPSVAIVQISLPSAKNGVPATKIGAPYSIHVHSF